MNRKCTLVITLIVVLLIALSTNLVTASGSLAIDSYVIGGGGGTTTAGSYEIDSTIGQPVAGIASNAPYQICSGFWCWAWALYRQYLPVILR